MASFFFLPRFEDRTSQIAKHEWYRINRKKNFEKCGDMRHLSLPPSCCCFVRCYSKAMRLYRIAEDQNYAISLPDQRQQNDARYAGVSTELRRISRTTSDHNQVMISHRMLVSNTVQCLLTVPVFIVY